MIGVEKGKVALEVGLAATGLIVSLGLATKLSQARDAHKLRGIDALRARGKLSEQAESTLLYHSQKARNH